MSTQPDPGIIMQTLCAFQQTEALKAAIDLDVFTHIASGAATAADIARRAAASERGMRILCDYLTILGYLSKSGDRYSPSPTAAVFLDKRSASYIGGMAHFLTHKSITAGFRDLKNAVTRGGSALGEVLDPEHPAWVQFARSMSGFLGMVAHLAAKAIARPGEPQKVLDIAAGHGMFGIAVAQANPQAEVYALDWKNVLEVAQENAVRLNVADRFHLIPGSAFQVDLGDAYDVILVPNFLHHFDIPTCTGFLRRVHAALRPGGSVAVVEFVPNEDRVTPAIPAAFSLQMLGGTPSGDAYTYRELAGMLHEAGFPAAHAQALSPSPQTLVTATRP